MELTHMPIGRIIQVLMSQRAIMALLKARLTTLQQQITVDQLVVLVHIRENGLVSQQELAHLTDKDKSNIHRMIGYLNSKGLVCVQRDPLDKRRNLVGLTEDAQNLCTGICENMTAPSGSRDQL